MYPHKLYSPSWLWVFWVVHILLLILELVVISYFVLDWDARVQHVPGGYALGLALVFVDFCSEPTEMVLWSYHIMEPWLYLTLQSLKAMLWTALVPVGIIATIQSDISPDWFRSVVRGLIFALLILTALSYYASLLYAFVICRRNKKTGGYEYPYDEEKRNRLRRTWRFSQRSGHEKLRPGSFADDP